MSQTNSLLTVRAHLAISRNNKHCYHMSPYRCDVTKTIFFFLLLMPVAIGPASAEDNYHWDMSVGLDYSVGKYGGSSDTDVLSVPFTARIQADRLRLEVTIPYLHVTGPGIVVGGPVIGGTGAASTRSGLGDTNLGAAWLLHKDEDAFPAIELAGTIKAPTAATNLGTGKPDYTAFTNIYHSITPSVMLFGTIGYQWLNNFRTYDLKDGVTATVGANFKLSSDTSVGLSSSYRQEYFSGLGEQLSLSPYALWNLSENWRVNGYGIIGFTSASPRIGGGFRLICFQ